MDRIITKMPSRAPIDPAKKRVAAYACVSGGKDAMLQSLAAQVSDCSEMIQKQPAWSFVRVYTDEAFTGTKDARPALQSLLADCRAGMIDLVITKSISQFARNTVTLLDTVRELKALGVSVLYEKENIESMSGDGELMLSILASFAQEESRSVSDNCKWRIRKDFQDGIPCSLVLFGYREDGDTLYIVQEQAEVVRMIFALYLEGMGRNAIMKHLNALSIKPPVKDHWHESSIDNILQNEKYIGDTIMQKTFIADHLTKRKAKNRGELPMYLVENSHEAIISREGFERVQALRAQCNAHYHAASSTPKTYPFTSKMRCGHCGQHFRRAINSAGTKYARPVWMYITYDKYGKAACPAKKVPEDILLALSAEVLGLPEFDERAFAAMVQEIQVPEPGRLVFITQHGSIEKTWEHASRKWSDEAKQQARDKALAQWEARRDASCKPQGL